LTWLAQLEGAVPKAEAYFIWIEPLLCHRADDPASRAIHAAQRAALALAWDDWDHLGHWMRLVEAAAPWAEQPFSESGRIETLTLAHASVACASKAQEAKMANKALTLLAHLQQCVGKDNTGRLSLEILAVKACALFILDGESALEPLERLLALAEPEGFCRLFLILGKPMEALLRQAAKEGISPEYTNRLLLAFAIHKPVQDKLLTEREIDVLHLVAAGQSNQAVADALCVSVNTVKTHLKRINTKLETDNRLAAVSRARQLSLL
jgi:LuxR family maltose regulon positive regulatory protein